MLNFQILTDKDRREAALLESRRAKEAERSKRIFNPRVRLIGVDLEALNRQVEERKQREKYEKDVENIFHEQAKKADEIAYIMEDKEKQERLKTELEILDYRKNYQKLENRREFDLNDPGYIMKQTPVRGNGDDSHLGLSAAQKFEGEDLAGEQRRKVQHEEIRSWLEQQMREKELAEKDQKTAEEAYKAALLARDERAIQVEQLEKECRKRVEEASRKYNEALAQEKLCQKQRRAKEERDDDMADICNFLNSDLMTENPSVAQSNLGPQRKISSLYKGMTLEQKLQIREDQRIQAEEARKRKEQEIRRDREMDEYTNGIQRTIYLLDQENALKEKQRQKEICEENKRLAEEQKQRKKFLESVVYRNLPSDSFYDQFNTTTR